MHSGPHKRTLLKLAAAGALALLALAACGRKEEPAASAPATSAPEPAAAAPLKAAWSYVGPVGNAGWSSAHDQGRLAVQAAFGERIQTSSVESVPEGADTERVLRDLIAQGNTLPEGQNDLIMPSERIPAEVRAQIEKVKAGMKDGSFDVFTGPVVDVAGKEHLAAGTRADDAWMGAIGFFVKGAEGQIPASK